MWYDLVCHTLLSLFIAFCGIAITLYSIVWYCSTYALRSHFESVNLKIPASESRPRLEANIWVEIILSYQFQSTSYLLIRISIILLSSYILTVSILGGKQLFMAAVFFCIIDVGCWSNENKEWLQNRVTSKWFIANLHVKGHCPSPGTLQVCTFLLIP